MEYKAYVWDEWKPDWSDGLAVVIAKSITSARAELRKSCTVMVTGWISEYSEAQIMAAPKVYALDQPRAWEVAGGA